MELLGKLGIDVWLVLAQIVNFVLLIWVLRKYVYTPLLTWIEKDEDRRNVLTTGLNKLEEDKKQLEIDRKLSLDASRKQSEDILKKAEKLAEDVKNAGVRKTDEIKQEMLIRSEEEIKAQKFTVIDQMRKQLQSTVRDRLGETMNKLQNSGVIVELQRSYVDPIIGEIRDVPLDNVDQIQNAIVSYGSEVDEDIMEKIKLTIREKIGHDVSIDVQKKPEMIAGFIVELGGFQLIHNFIEDITYATRIKTP